MKMHCHLKLAVILALVLAGCALLAFGQPYRGLATSTVGFCIDADKDGACDSEQGAHVASAATIVLSDQHAAFYVTGTTNIDTINSCDSSHTGKQKVLLFGGILTMGDLTGNVDLSGGFETTPGDTLSIICMYDGSNYYWRQVGRNVN